MNRPACVAAILALTLGLLSCTGEPTGPSAAEALKSLDSDLGKAIDAKNVETIAAFYADDAILMPTAEPIVRGRQAIAEEWEHILAIPDFQNDSKLEGVEVSSSGDLAYTFGSYRSRMMGEDDKLVVEPGKWLTIWKRRPDGRWRIAVETYNTDIPPPDHK